MAELFISYARSSEAQAAAIAQALVARGLTVWRDDALPPHRTYAEVIEEHLRAAAAVLVLWTADAVKSQWVRAEAEVARELGTLVQISLDGVVPPLPFNQIQCADLRDWRGELTGADWRKVLASIDELVRGKAAASDGEAVVSPLPLPRKPSIAVLPFADLGGGAEHDFLADGMVEEISTVLSRFQSLFVIAGQSSLTYRDTQKTAQQIARELGVRYLLEGSVRRAGSRVRISARLVDAVAGEQIWAEHFDDGLDDVFALQDRIAASVASHIDSTIETAEMRRATARRAGAADAIELVWRANAAIFDADRAVQAAAIADAERAVAIDPDNAWAVATAGFCHGVAYSSMSTTDPVASRAAALTGYERALRLDGQDPQVLCLAAAIQLQVAGDLDAANRLIDQAIAANDGSANSLYWGGWIDLATGRAARGLERLQASLRLNPRTPHRPFNLAGIGLCLFALERYGEAITHLSEAVAQRPKYGIAIAALAASLALDGKRTESHDVAKRIHTVGTAERFAQVFRDPEQRERLRAGIALAESAGTKP
jgi:adenylate cyclase